MASVPYAKYPDEIVEFDIDCSDILVNGDTVANAVVSALSGGITIVSPSFTAAAVAFRVSGGAAGTYAYALVSVTTASGLFREGSVAIEIKKLPGA